MTDKFLNSIAAGFISVSEDRVETSRVELGKVDVLIAFGSYEPRCTALTTVRRLEAAEGIVLQFASPKGGSNNGRSESANFIASNLRERGLRTRLIELPESVAVDEVRARVSSMMQRLGADFGRSFSLALDITTCPKILFSYILAAGFATGMISRLELHYAEADYGSSALESGVSADGHRFTDGDWAAAQVPYLEGRFMASRPRHAVVAMGADAASVEKLVRRYDPDAMTLLCPIPGANTNIEALTIQSARRIAKGYTHVREINVNPFSAVDMMQQLLILYEDRKALDDLIFFCLGTKPHSLGMSLAAFKGSQAQVVFRVPKKYSERRNSANGWSWVYTVRDRSNPSEARSYAAVHAAALSGIQAGRSDDGERNQG